MPSWQNPQSELLAIELDAVLATIGYTVVFCFRCTEWRDETAGTMQLSRAQLKPLPILNWVLHLYSGHLVHSSL